MAGLGDAEVLWVEVIAGPVDEQAALVIQILVRSSYSLDQPLVSGNTSAVFRRASPCSADQVRNPTGIG